MSDVVECLISAISKDLYEGPLEYCTNQCNTSQDQYMRLGVNIQEGGVVVIIDKTNTPFFSITALKEGFAEKAVKEFLFSLIRAVNDGRIDNIFTSDYDKGTRFLVTHQVPIKKFHNLEFLRNLTKLNQLPLEVKDKLNLALKHFLNE